MAFIRTWAHAIDSLVRIQRLLTHPDSDLDGRRDPALAPSLRVFLEGSAVTAAGTVAGNLRDTLMDPDLPRQAHVMSQVWVRTNGEPGWQEFRQFVPIGGHPSTHSRVPCQPVSVGES